MPRPKTPTPRQDKIEIEPGADKRLANILKKALNTPRPHKAGRYASSSRNAKRK
jgi:hypothetical protein